MDLKAFLDGERPILPGRGFAGIVESPPAKPLCAAVEGYALAGGFEVMLACDLVVAARDATFGLPEVKRGLVAGGGGILRLARRLPPAVALEAILTGDTLDAVRAHQLGLVTQVTEPGEALAGALALAERIAANGPLAVRESKRLAGAATAAAPEVWAEQLQVALEVMDSDDAREGASAFAERRAPVWTGR
jgi:enoyl-CoA hydratase